eukprot:gene17493-19243_t
MLSPDKRKRNLYPVALMPGQYQEYYKKYTQQEMNSLPLSTLLSSWTSRSDYDLLYSRELEQDNSDSSNSQDASDDEQESSESESQSEAEEPTAKRPLRDRNPVATSRIRNKTAGIRNDSFCGICLKGADSNKKGVAEELVHCSFCENSGHPTCLDMNRQLVEVIKTYAWQCMECKTCTLCSNPHDEEHMMFCDNCDRGYHSYCAGLRSIPDGRWVCERCGKCSSCLTVQPCLDGTPGKWREELTRPRDGSEPEFLQFHCHKCSKLFRAGNFCPVCLKVYRSDEKDLPMVCCDLCDRWIHTDCDDIDDKKYQELSKDNSATYKSTCYCSLFGSSVKTASSSYSAAFLPDHASINSEYSATTQDNTTTINNGGSWMTLYANVSSSWFFLDFGSNKIIRNITTKGNSHFNSWISEYEIHKKVDGGASFTLLKTAGNTNSHQAKVTSLDNENARYIKIIPKAFQRNISLRIEVQGCDKVDGGWSNWSGWRKCRTPCGGGSQYRYRSCTNPKPNLVGSYCPALHYDMQSCNPQPCLPVTMVLTLDLPGEAWSSNLLSATHSSHTSLCSKLNQHFTAVYVPASPITIQVTCLFFQINAIAVGVNASLLFDRTDPTYNMKLQDGLYFTNKINTMPAVLKSYTFVTVPYPPVVTGYAALDRKCGSSKCKDFVVYFTGPLAGADVYSYNLYHRLKTSDPAGAWGGRNCDYVNTAAASHSCIVYNFQPFHNYTVRIIPYSINGYGFSPTPIWVTTLTSEPDKPTNVVAAMVSSTAIKITWDPVPLLQMRGNSEGYQVNIWKHGFSKHVRILDHWTTFLQVTGLEEYVSYNVKIRAKNSVYWGPYSSHSTVRTDEDIPSAPPTSLSIQAASSTSVLVNWGDVLANDRNGIIINYKLNISLGNSMAQQFATINVGTNKQRIVGGLHFWTFYTVQVAAVTSKGIGPYSPAKTSRTSEHQPSVAPGNFVGSVSSSSKVTFTWFLISLPLRNGIITKYRVSYFPLNDASNVQSIEYNGELLQAGVLNGLLYWTTYNFSIAARTSPGYGPESAYITLRTEENIPTRPPVNVIGFNTSSYSINVTWQPIEGQYRHGVILGYEITYKSVMDPAEFVLRNEGSANVTIELQGLRNYTEYTITVGGYNIKGVGTRTMIKVRTEEQVPSLPPTSIKSFNTSSTSLWVEWGRIPNASHRGNLLGYIIRYTHIVENRTMNMAIYGEDSLSHNLTGLDEYRLYRIEVAGFTKVGIGPYTVTTAVTDEDAPAGSPVALTGQFANHPSSVTSTGLLISWSNVPDPDRNGEIRSFTVFYKVNERIAPVRATNGREYLKLLMENKNQSEIRRRRSIGAEYQNSEGSYLMTATGLRPEDKKVDLSCPFKIHHRRTRRSVTDVTSFNIVSVPGNESGLELNNLEPYANYTIVIQATTSKGGGPLSQPLLSATDESVPVTHPQSFTAAFSSSTSILTSWQPVPYADSKGIVYAYVISVWMTNSSQPWQNHTQFEPSLQFVITNLYKYVDYSIKVSAVTSKGSGPFTPAIIARTDQDIPSTPPANVTGQATSSTTIFINWKPVQSMPTCCVHGILTGYRIWYGKKYPSAGDTVSEVVIPPNQLYATIHSLDSFTPYSIEVAAETIKGHGPKHRIKVWTNEAKPILPPQTVKIVNTSSTSLLIEWNEAPFMQRKGYIRGYAVYYKITASSHALSVKWLDMPFFTANYTIVYQPPVQIEIDDIIRRLRYELTGLKKFMQYTIYLTSYTKVGIGPWTYATHAMTDQDVPSLPAVNVTAQATSYSTILVSWDPIPIQYDPSIEDPVCCVHGNLTGYTIFYSRITQDKVFNKTLSLAYLRNFTNSLGNTTSNATLANSTRTSFILTELVAYKTYSIYVAGNTIKGHGVLGEAIYVRTKQNVPTKEPSLIKGWNLTSTELYVEWGEIPWEYRNGIITSYIIYYRESLDPASSEANITVHSKYNFTKLNGLKKWTFYDIQVYGATIFGQGTISANITIRTDQDVPSKTPQNVVAVDYTGPYSILVKWSPVPYNFIHGILLGYNIFYEKISEADKEISNRYRQVHVKTVSPNEINSFLEYLPTYCTYRIRIAGFTIKGNGPKSPPIVAKTCRCRKHLYTNWWPLPPYNFAKDSNGYESPISSVSNLSFVPNGIFGHYLRDMAIWSCGDCNGPRGHGYSVVHFDIDEDGHGSRRKNEKTCIAHAHETVDFTFPVLGRQTQTKFLTTGKFLPLLQHTDSAVVVMKKVTIISRSSAMKKAMLSLWPLFMLNIFFATLAGFIIWFLDFKSNPEFPSTILNGIWYGFWWAYITMTTVGYGDITPRSFLAKCFSVVWILFGLLLYAILSGTLTTALLTKQQVIVEKIGLYDNKVAFTNGLFEEKIAMAHQVKPVGKETVPEILNLVKSDHVSAALVDTYVLSLYDHFFGDSPMYVQQIVKSHSFSYGFGLMGNITKLSKLFHQYEVMTQADISALLTKYVHVKLKDESTVADIVPDDTSMFSASSSMYKNVVYTLIAMTCMGGSIGIVFTIFNSVRKKRLKSHDDAIESLRMSNPTVQAMEQLWDTNEDIWGSFAERITKKVERIDEMQMIDRLHLIHLYRVLKRSRRNGTEISEKLKTHRINIKNIGKCYREIDRMDATKKTLDKERSNYAFIKLTQNNQI